MWHPIFNTKHVEIYNNIVQIIESNGFVYTDDHTDNETRIFVYTKEKDGLYIAAVKYCQRGHYMSSNSRFKIEIMKRHRFKFLSNYWKLTTDERETITEKDDNFLSKIEDYFSFMKKYYDKALVNEKIKAIKEL
jgi:hypothetical protein